MVPGRNEYVLFYTTYKEARETDNNTDNTWLVHDKKINILFIRVWASILNIVKKRILLWSSVKSFFMFLSPFLALTVHEKTLGLEFCMSN